MRPLPVTVLMLVRAVSMASCDHVMLSVSLSAPFSVAVPWHLAGSPDEPGSAVQRAVQVRVLLSDYVRRAESRASLKERLAYLEAVAAAERGAAV